MAGATAAETASAHLRISKLSVLMKVMVTGSNPPALASRRSSMRPAAATRAAAMPPQAVMATILGADHRTFAAS